MTTMFVEHSRDVKRSRLQEKFHMAAFLIRNIYIRKHSCFWFPKVAKFTKISKKIELNLTQLTQDVNWTYIRRSEDVGSIYVLCLLENIEFGRVVLFTILSNRKSFWITCSIPSLGRWDISSRLCILSRLKKSTYKGGAKMVLCRFNHFLVSYKQSLSHIEYIDFWFHI